MVGGRRARGLRLAASLLALAAVACSGIPLPLVRPATPSPPADSIEAFVPTAVAFVEQHRGHRFKTPVKVAHLAGGAFAARVVQLQRRDRADLDRQARRLRALGLVPPGLDVEKAEEALLGAEVIGFYDPRTKELVVRGDRATAAVRPVVVHELTHALQDQWFGLNGSPGTDQDADLAFTALVEGDALRIEAAYRQSESSTAAPTPAETPADPPEPGAAPPVPRAAAPRALEELLAFPYIVGPTFTEALLAARGPAGLDRAFADRPVASTQVLHPERYLDRVLPAPVEDPAADGPVVERGSLGEFGFDLLLGGPAGGSDSQAGLAAQAWAGDRFVVWPQGAGYCVRDRLALDGEQVGAELVSELQGWAAGQPDARFDAGPQPVLTSCG